MLLALAVTPRVPAHAVVAVILGYYIGLAKFERNSILLLFTGPIFAIIMHGIYDSV